MKNEAGIILILVSLFILYTYNTGRLSGIIQVLKDPSHKPTTSQIIGVTNPVTSSGGGDPLGGLSGIFQDILPVLSFL